MPASGAVRPGRVTRRDGVSFSKAARMGVMDVDEVVTVVDYDPKWPAAFAAEAARLRACVVPPVTEIHHVGSTAVRGLAGKPIIDLLLGVPDFKEAPRVADLLEQIGYENFGEMFISGRYYLRSRGEQHFNVAVAGTAGSFFDTQLTVRDYLRAHPAAAAEYATQKRKALSEGARMFSTYSQRKQAAVEGLMSAALAWKSRLHEESVENGIRR